MKTPVIWLTFNDTPARARWDQDVLDILCPNDFYEHHEYGPGKLVFGTPGGAVVVYAAGDNEQYIPQLNTFLKQFTWIVLLLTSDECSNFPWHRIHHPNMRLWIQSARSDKHRGDNITYFPVGCPDTQDMLASIPTKDIDVGFSGQITHLSREQMAWAFEASINATIKPSPGFTQGLEREEYLKFMSRTKVAPCPSGPCHADTFRLYEALEAGCVPILDHGPRPDDQGRAVAGFPRDFWIRLFGHPPIPVVEGWSQAPGIAESILGEYPVVNNVVSAWWQRYKRDLRLKLLNDVGELGGNYAGPPGSNITVVVPSSPTPNNPDFSHLSATIEAIRDQLPNSEILLMLDGLHPAQSHLAANYHEYVRRVLWMCNHHWYNITPFLYEDYLHQSGKLIRTLPHIRTDFILWNEHDTPLEGDIDWEACITELAEDRLDLIRFYHEPNVHPEHEWLMRGRHNDMFLRTVQQSGRPHLATTSYYRRVMADHFSDDSCTFIEYVLHSVCQQEDIQPWEKHRMALYAPVDADVIKRSGHVDARGGESTFEETLRV